MRKIITILAICFIALPILKIDAAAQKNKNMSLVDSLKTIDSDLRKYFPRWKVCEPDLCTKIYEAFVQLGFDKRLLDKQNIEVLAAPKKPKEKYFEILLISCGESSLNSMQIAENIRTLERIISGQRFATSKEAKERTDITDYRNYCLTDIPPENPLKDVQAKEIIDWFRPTSSSQSISVSLFEQSLKIGETGAWIHSIIGNDAIGYPFWTGGEAKLLFETPLYQNTGSNRKTLPYLIMANLGFGYRLKGGLNEESTALSWIPDRLLNSGPGGKFVAGFDFNLPMHTNLGIHFNTEVPTKKLITEGIDKTKDGYSFFPAENVNHEDPSRNITEVAPILRVNGQASLFYNLWVDEFNPEHYFRFDLGMQYSEIQEYALINDQTGAFLTKDSISGLKLYKPNEFGDWLYAKVEYRNQGAFPFGLSAQYSNQIFLGRVYMRIIGDWLFLEGKYATPLRGVRPFEKENFFMVSPVLRLAF